MASLKQVAGEPVSFREKLKINAEKFKLAGIGLASIAESERERLYKQVLSMGESYGGSDTLLGQITLIGSGTFNLIKEESQKVFDELVAEGEAALSKDKSPVVTGSDKITQARPVAKTRPETAKKPKKVVSMTADQSQLATHLQVRLKQAQRKIADTQNIDEEQRLTLEALGLQALEGDVKGRRPAQTKAQERKLFDRRRKLKGMKAEEAVLRFEALVDEFSQVPAI